MIRRLCERVCSLFSQEPKDSGTGDNRFVPSPLDMSVRSSHGGPDVEIERELHRISEQARDIEEQQRGW